MSTTLAGPRPQAVAAPQPPRGPARRTTLKRLLFGRPLATEDAPQELLPKRLALPIFASDALSSVVYATEEIMLVLAAAGTAALTFTLPVAGAIGALMLVVVTSYRQTVRAYPSGGGAYIVAHENLGERAGLVAAAALLTDYVLTVAVSIAAGAFALASLAPSLLEHRVALSLGFVALVTLVNLRGTRESGRMFALPTYAFVVSILAMVAVGLARCATGGCTEAVQPSGATPAIGGVGLLVVLRAFASGSSALTGVEAIANGVPAFRGRGPQAQARNAGMTLAMLGGIAVTMLVGIAALARLTGVRPSADRSVVSQIAEAVFGGGIGFAAVQITTALILVLAANTAYQDFPRLAAILARDRFMPRQFMNRGDRLGYSNGIIVLAGLASALVLIYAADVSRLIQLYVVGVFTSFTLSQSGMVHRWWRLRPPGWRRGAALNLVGATATAVVLVVVAATKFAHGAWIVIVAIPLFVAAFRVINRHYRAVGDQLRLARDIRTRHIHSTAVVLVPEVDRAVRKAVAYARALRPAEVRGLHVDTGRGDEVASEWVRAFPRIPLDRAAGRDGHLVDAIRSYVAGALRGDGAFVTIVVPETLDGQGWRQLLHKRRGLLLKSALLTEPGIAICDVPLATERIAAPRDDPDHAPTRIETVVLVSGVHNATMRAVAYARALRHTSLSLVTFNVDPRETERIMREWMRRGEDVPLQVIDSPYREIVRPLLRHVRDLRDARPGTTVSVVLPEIIPRRWWQRALHNQTAIAIKAALLLEPNVTVTSVPYRLH